MVTIQVLRIGSLRGSCSVRYRTKDHSAIAGVKYEYKNERVDFGPGENSRRFEIKIVNDDSFDSTLEFEIFLEEPENCVINNEMSHTRVKILDDDLFPSNRFKEAIQKGEDALNKVGFPLLWSFMKFTFFHIPDIGWKSILSVFLAQFGNIYYYLTIKIRAAIIDCLTGKHEKLPGMLASIFPGHRHLQALTLGAMWILPNFFLLGIDYGEMVGLEMGFNIRKHLRVNLFRKYLNYSPESRQQVPIQDLKACMMEDIPDVVANGYLIIFDILQTIGKICVVVFFMISENPDSSFTLCPLILIAFYVVVMLVSMIAVHETRLKFLADEGQAESDTANLLIHADLDHRLITDYKTRSIEVSRFEEQLMSQRTLAMKLKRFNFKNGLLIPWITIGAVGFTMMAGTSLVPHVIGVGTFAATLNALRDLGDRFAGLQNHLEDLFSTISALVGLTVNFNLPTDLSLKRDITLKRDAFMSEYVETHGQQHGYDDIPIIFKDVTVEYSPSLSAGRGINVHAIQGTVIHVTGPHDSGKSTMLGLLSDNINPLSGDILCPLHLRILQVSYQPMLVGSRNLYENLTFGKMGHEPENPERVRRIITRLGLHKSWLRDKFDEDVGKLDERQARDFSSDEDSGEEDEEEDDEAEDGSRSWQDRLSNSEKKRLHLARAFVYNPEVMVLHKPIDELDNDLANAILAMLREFVDQRGVEVDPATIALRRPRTLIFTGGMNKSHLKVVDTVWTVGQGPGIIVEPGDHQR